MIPEEAKMAYIIESIHVHENTNIHEQTNISEENESFAS